MGLRLGARFRGGTGLRVGEGVYDRRIKHHIPTKVIVKNRFKTVRWEFRTIFYENLFFFIYTGYLVYFTWF